VDQWKILPPADIRPSEKNGTGDGIKQCYSHVSLPPVKFITSNDMHVVSPDLTIGGRRTTFARPRQSGNGADFRSIILRPQEEDSRIKRPEKKKCGDIPSQKDHVPHMNLKKFDGDALKSDGCK
jgi:hypothetical protein